MKKQLLVAVVLSLLTFSGYTQCTLNLSTTCICKGGGNNCDLLPDITVSRPNLLIYGSNGHIEYPQVCNPPCNGNDARLRISVSTPNIGHGPLETRGQSVWICGTDTFYVYQSTCPNTGLPPKQLIKQRVYHKSPDDTMRYTDYPSGSMTYHPSHGHQHIDNWGIYTLRTQTSNPDPLTWPIIGTGSKLAFCLLDIGSCNGNSGYCVDSAGNTLNSTNIQNYGLGGGNYGCSNTVQGISAGFLDTYSQSLDGMWINLPAGLCNGQYWIVVQVDNLNLFREENDNNNVMAVPVNLTQQSGSVPTITASGPTTFCTGGSVTLTCAAAQNYAWSNGATTQSITINQSGNYNVTVNTGTSCATTSSTTTVTVTPFNVTASAIPNATCPGDLVQLNATAPGSGTTTSPAAFTSNTSVAIPDTNPTGASSSLTVSGINPSTLSSTSVVSVKINITHTYDGDLLIQLISPSGNTINLSNRRGGSGDNFVNTIFSASAVTSIVSGSAPFTGSYTPEGAFSALTGNINGTWTLKVIDQAGNDVGTINNWTLTVNNTVPAVLNYSWSSTPAGFSSLNQNPTANPNATITYTVNVTESGTGCIGSQSTTVNVGGNLNVTTNNPAPICAGGSTVLTASGANNYVWSPSSGLSAITGTSVTANPASTTTYRVVGSSNNCSDTSYVTVTVNTSPVFTSSITGTSAVCLPFNGSYNITGVTGAQSFSWTVPSNTTITTGQGTTAININTTSITNGNICLVATNNCGSNNSCIPFSAQASSPGTPGSVNGPIRLCQGDVATFSVLPVARAYSYNWSLPSGMTITNGQGTNSINVSIHSTFSGGTLSVIASNGCGNGLPRTRTLSLNTPGTPSAISGNGFGVCSSIQPYSATAVAGMSYSWVLPSGATITGNANSNAVNISFDPAFNSGTIAVQAANNCGVSSLRNKTIRSYPQIAGSISGLTNVCTSQTGVAYSIAAIPYASSYIWTVPSGGTIASGQGTTSVTVNFGMTTGNRNVSVRGHNDCGNGSARTLSVTISSCPKLSNDEFINENDLNLYPNPADNYVEILFKSDKSDHTYLTLTDIIGKKVYSQNIITHEGRNSYVINLKDVPSGIYLLSFKNNSINITKRLVIEQ